MAKKLNDKHFELFMDASNSFLELMKHYHEMSKEEIEAAMKLIEEKERLADNEPFYIEDD